MSSRSRALSINYTRPFVYDYQRSFMDNPERFTITEASTKVGKTAGCVIWLFEQSLRGKRGNRYWWIAPIFAQAKIAFERMKRQVSVRGFFIANETNLTLTLPNGSVIEFKSAEKPDSLYGEDVYAAVFDEFTRARESAWFALRSTLTSTGGKCKFIGNVRGRGWGYKLAQKAKNGADKEYAYRKITCWDAVDAGRLSMAEVLQAKSDLPEHVFKELYEAEPSDDGGNPFGINNLDAAKRAGLSDDESISYGVDLASTIDFTVIIGLDDNKRVSHFERYQKDWGRTTISVLTLPDVPTAVDATGVGKPIVEELQKDRQNTEGFVFTAQSKQLLIEGLATAFQRGEITFPEGSVLEDELYSFEYQYTRTGVKYCVSLDTMILTSDLRWIAAEALKSGDKIIGFDEFPIEGNKTRNYCESVILAHDIIEKPCYKITLNNGEELISSEEHLWLVDTGNPTKTGGKCEWRRTDQLRGKHSTYKSFRYAPNKLIKLMSPWFLEDSYEAGYLAGIFDGEGSLSQKERLDHKGNTLRLSFAQRENKALEYAVDCVKQFGYTFSNGGRGGTNKDVVSICLNGRRGEVLRFLGSIRPKRLLNSFNPNKLGTLEMEAAVPISSIEFIGNRFVVAMQTSSRTFIANGYASHNCAPEGLHDDCVMALALAYDQWRNQPIRGSARISRPSIRAPRLGR